MINNGLVQGVEVTEMKVKVPTEIVSLFAVSGIVGINYATVKECGLNTTEDIEIENTQTPEQILLFGGSVGFNVGNDAKIQLCYVSATTKVNVRLTRSGNGIAQAGGIAISNFSGSIVASGNSGNVIATSFNGTAYAAGTVVYSNGGSVYDCYNVGNVKGGEGYIGGVAYFLDSNIANLVGVGSISGETKISNFHIAGVFSGTKEATCYTRYDIGQTVVASALTSSRNFTTKLVGVTMVVSVSGSTYSITITKA